MMSITEHTLKIWSLFENIGEIKGEQDNPIIVLAHKLCGIEGKSYVDEIPWCSSGLNLCMVLANIQRNPSAAWTRLSQKFNKEMIEQLFKLAGHNIKALYPTEHQWVEPTWSASSKSWDDWGVEVKEKDMIEGDIVRLTRDGGGHVAQFKQRNLLTYTLCGANQSNKFSTSDTYAKTRFVTARRGK